MPIRLDMEIEGQKLRDTFTWNKNGKFHRIRRLQKFRAINYAAMKLPSFLIHRKSYNA